MVKEAKKRSRGPSGRGSRVAVDPSFTDFEPKTELGQVLLEARKAIIASGVPLLDEEGIEREVADRRGGLA